MKLKIDHTKSCLPILTSSGDVAQRMQKARLLNLKFYDNLQDHIRNNEIAPKTFVKTLRDTVGAKLGVFISSVESKENAYCAYFIDEKAKVKGFVLGMPLAFHTDRVHKNSAQTFLKQTQNLFNEVFNPKILQRFVTLLNKHYNVKAMLEFYKENVSQTAKLTPESLASFLEGKKNQEVINSLQFMRYKLLSEKNTALAKYQIDKRIERHNNIQYVMKEDHYSLDKYHFDEKLKLLEDKIEQAIIFERNSF